MRLDAVATVAVFVVALASMLFIYVNARYAMIRYSVEAWRCAEIQVDKILAGKSFDSTGSIKVKFLYWNMTIRERIEESDIPPIGCAYTYRIGENGALVYVKVCPCRICKP